MLLIENIYLRLMEKLAGSAADVSAVRTRRYFSPDVGFDYRIFLRHRLQWKILNKRRESRKIAADTEREKNEAEKRARARARRKTGTRVADAGAD